MLLLATAAALAGSTLAARAESNSALLDVLVRKGILTEKEAAGVQEEVTTEEKKSSANKIKLSNSISELRLYGDVRLRYQYDDKDTQLTNEQGGGSNVSQRSRWRFRLRLNADFKLGENVFGGVELQTNQASDSANQSFENGFDDYGIFISRAYLGWNVTPWLTVVGGKMPNPFYTTELVWDSDISPTGLAESIAFHKIWGSHEEVSTGGFSKDGKSVAPSAPEPSPWELTLNAGQFIFDDNNEFNGPDNDSSTDAYLFHTQIVSTYRFSKALSLTVAPGWMTYINGSVTGAASDGGLFNENDFSDIAGVSGATRNLNVLLLPGDLSFKVAGIKTKFFWDFAYNLDGRKRVEEIYNVVDRINIGDDPDDRQAHSPQDNFAYLVGLQLGENKKAGDWSVAASWRQTGLGAVDPNINDSDFAGAELNTRGFKLGLNYNFTDFAVGTITYANAWNVRGDLFGGQATGGNAVADANSHQLLQVDLTVKF
jgi:hypothetical protein